MSRGPFVVRGPSLIPSPSPGGRRETEGDGGLEAPDVYWRCDAHGVFEIDLGDADVDADG